MPNFLALTSLFYEGNISCHIEVEEHKKNRKCFYNVYSLPELEVFCEKSGYLLKKFAPFNIDIDLQRPDNMDAMGTYTERIMAQGSGSEKRIQISGPLLMNWYMVLIQKKTSS